MLEKTVSCGAILSIVSVNTTYQNQPGVDANQYWQFPASVVTTGTTTIFTNTGRNGVFYHDDSGDMSVSSFPQVQSVTGLASPDEDQGTIYDITVFCSNPIGQIFSQPDRFGGVTVTYHYKGPLMFAGPPPPPPPPPPSAPITPVASYALSEDAHGRPVALSSNYATLSNAKTGPSNSLATSINSLVSSDAGKTYLANGLSDEAIAIGGGDNIGADNPCLLIDRRTNHFRAIYSLSQAYTYGGAPKTRPPDEIILATGLLDDRLNASVAVIPNISGGLCVAAQHPTDADYALLVYSDIGTVALRDTAALPGSHDLKAAFSMDAGATWTALSTVLPALDLTATGRPALCFLGNTAILVYSQGNTLSALTSLDRGKTWTPAPSPVSVYTPNDGTNNVTFGYFCLSMAAHGGQVFLLAFAGDTQASSVKLTVMRPVPPQTSPRLFVSGDAGRTWTLRAAEPVGPKSAPAEYTAALPGVFPVFPAYDGTGDTESITPPSGIGISPASGLLRLDTSYVSHNCGLTWPPP